MCFSKPKPPPELPPPPIPAPPTVKTTGPMANVRAAGMTPTGQRRRKGKKSLVIPTSSGSGVNQSY